MATTAKRGVTVLHAFILPALLLVLVNNKLHFDFISARHSKNNNHSFLLLRVSASLSVKALSFSNYSHSQLKTSASTTSNTFASTTALAVTDTDTNNASASSTSFSSSSSSSSSSSDTSTSTSTPPCCSTTRRDALFSGAASLFALVLAAPTKDNNSIANAVYADDPIDSDSSARSDSDVNSSPSTSPPMFLQRRNDLLSKIQQKAPDNIIAEAIQNLEIYDPSDKKAATSPYLGGQWELIYSVNADAFSPLLNLPKPIRPTSMQLIGDAATDVVGEGRIAQLLNFPIVPFSLILSSGAVPYYNNANNNNMQGQKDHEESILEIFPPFRLEGNINKFKIVESDSDAEFRALNARNEDAQLAGRNLYKQRYLETTGQKGDLRISQVIAGDPVLVTTIITATPNNNIL